MEIQAPFSVAVDVRNGVGNIVVTGELDLATVSILTEHLVHLERVDVNAIMIDLRRITFLDCSALHAFLTAQAHAEQNGHLFILVGADSRTRRVFQLTATEHLLDDAKAADVISKFTAGADRSGGVVSLPAAELQSDV